MFLSCRAAAKVLGFNKDTVFRQYAENEHFGFLRKTSGGFLGVDGHGIAARYRFTDIPYGTRAATRDFDKWDGSPFVYRRRRRAQKKQKPVLSVRTPCPARSDIGKISSAGSVCPARSDIGTDPNCPARSDITSLPFPKAGEGRVQGSLTARAPVQAGGAGSSPAPVAMPNLTTMVLGIVNAQLGELDERWRQSGQRWH